MNTQLEIFPVHSNYNHSKFQNIYSDNKIMSWLLTFISPYLGMSVRIVLHVHFCLWAAIVIYKNDQHSSPYQPNIYNLLLFTSVGYD